MDFSPVPSREHVIVWEVRPDEVRGALIAFGAEQRIVIVRTWQAQRGGAPPSFLKLKQFRRVPVIVSLHPSLARTFILPFKMTRKKTEGPLRPEELQGRLRDFLSQTTFEMRRLSADDLEVEELDAVLIDARLARLTVDGVETRDDRPISGKKIEGYLQAVFTTRTVFHDLHDLLHSGRQVFITERGPAGLAFLGRHLETPLALLDIDAKGGGWLFRFDPAADEIVKKEDFKWAGEDPVLEFVNAWGVSKKAAAELYALFLKGGFSERASRFARQLFKPAVAAFDKALAQALSKAKATGRVYVRASVPPPFELPAKMAGAEVAPLPLEQLFEEAGLSVQLSPAELPKASFLLLPFLEYYYHRGDPQGHKALTRHIHWIAP